MQDYRNIKTTNNQNAEVPTLQNRPDGSGMVAALA